MPKRIFLSDSHQQTFDRQGFLMQPFLSAEEVARPVLVVSFISFGYL
jgi:hypothetical protein